MAGISSRAANVLENKKNKFQNQEFNDDLGVNYYEFKWRNHDPQIGRFIQIDPLSDKYVYNSTYAFSENHVTSHVELEGLEKVSINGTNNASMPILPMNLISKFMNWLNGISSGSGSSQPDGKSFTHKDGQGASTKSENPTGDPVTLDNLMDAAKGADKIGPLKPKPGESQWWDMWGHVKDVGDEILKGGDANKKSSEQKTEENTSSTSPNADNNKKDSEKKPVKTKVTRQSDIINVPDSIFIPAESNGTHYLKLAPNPEKKKND